MMPTVQLLVVTWPIDLSINLGRKGGKGWQFHGKGEPNTPDKGDADQGAKPENELPKSHCKAST
jgi:hypothetical protein